MTFTDSKRRFSNRAADYARYRPAYPLEVLDVLRDWCALKPEHAIADIGSGTGLLTKLVLENGNPVFGVEPNAEMRAAGEHVLQGCTNFSSVSGSAEATTLPSQAVDFITAGQAFHWFNVPLAAKEFRRILKPGGWVVVVWQDRRMEDTPFARAYEDLLERYCTDYKRVKDSYPETDKISTFFDRDSFRTRYLPNHQVFD